MKGGRRQEIERLYNSALERKPEVRAAFLHEACDDESLRTEFESLLACQAEAKGTAETPALEAAAQDPARDQSSEAPGGLAGRTLSHYRIIEKIGKGGMGEVYVAEDTHLGRQVAIKFPVLDGIGIEQSGRFLTEARSASRLDHPNIAHIYDYGEAPGGRPFLVMELVRGTTLREVLKSGALTAVRSIGIVDGVLRALREAHRNGLVHRDIKPANVMLTPTNEVKVLDFGLAKEIPDDLSCPPSQVVTSPMGHTQPGALPGTPGYMSPEQARGRRLDSRSDLFSAGLLLYECLTGRPAFSGSTPREALEQSVKRTHRPLLP